MTPLDLSTFFPPPLSHNSLSMWKRASRGSLQVSFRWQHWVVFLLLFERDKFSSYVRAKLSAQAPRRMRQMRCVAQASGPWEICCVFDCSLLCVCGCACVCDGVNGLFVFALTCYICSVAEAGALESWKVFRGESTGTCVATATT